MILMIEGNIGAGKSTFLSMVSRHLEVNCIYEPHTQWQNIGGHNLLDLFYKDMARWAYTFQSYAFISRIQAQQAQLKELTDKVTIIERSIFTDRFCFARNCYEMGFMTELEWHLYTQWFSWLLSTTRLPDAFVYLRTTPEICFDRMKKRNRSEEEGVSLDYLSLLHNRHEEWLMDKKQIDKNIADIPVIILECYEDFEHNQEEQKRIISTLHAFMSKQVRKQDHMISRYPSVL